MKPVPILMLAVCCVMAAESLNTQHVFHQLGFGSAPFKRYLLQGKNQEIQVAQEKHNVLAIVLSEHHTLAVLSSTTRQQSSGQKITVA